jgi:hypothetical protein
VVVGKKFVSAVRCGSDDVQRNLFGARGRLCWNVVKVMGKWGR